MSDIRVVDLFTDLGISFKTSGKNVAVNNIGIQCPFCGDADPSEHMGIHIETGYWSCWRDPDHRGRDLKRLLCQLSGFSKADAELIVRRYSGVELDRFDEKISNLLSETLPNQVTKEDNLELELLPEFDLIEKRGKGLLYYNYLKNRINEDCSISDFCAIYNLFYCTNGRWKNRIIIPIYDEGELVTWTSRSIMNNEQLRYMTLSHRPERSKERSDPQALVNISDVLFYIDGLRTSTYSDTLVITEGPFDAMVVDFLGFDNGISATCLFNTQLSDKQQELLESVVDKFKYKYVLFDDGMSAVAMRLCEKLSYIGFKFKALPEGIDDPAELNVKEILQIFK